MEFTSNKQRELYWYVMALAYMQEHEYVGNFSDATIGVCEVLYECGVNFSKIPELKVYNNEDIMPTPF